MEFLSARKWTNDDYTENERIECQFVFNIVNLTGDEWQGTLQVQANRPVYGHNISSNTYSILDKSVKFTYIEFQPFTFVEGSYSSEIASLLAYYSYMIIALDYDSFADMGGTEWFQKAQQVVNSSQMSQDIGWQSYDKNERNRYHLVNAFLDERYKPFRSMWYQYHRQGIDIMTSDPEKGRAVVLQSLESLQALKARFPAAPLWILFFDIKSNELINLFKQAPATEKTKVRNLLMEMDTPNGSRYEQELR